MSQKFQDVTDLTPDDVVEISRSFTHLHGTDSYMEDAARRVVNHLHNILRPTPDHPHQCEMVRLFITCGVDELPDELRLKVDPGYDENFRCLTLLASRGTEPSWNSRHTSQGHQVISLQREEVVRNIPMISNLIRMLGLNLNDVIKPDPSLNIAGFYPLSVFYVEDAAVSPYIPAKDDFVIPYNIQSVVGFGGLLNFSDMFTVIMFFNMVITEESAALFKNLADQVHQLLLPFHNNGQIFRP